MLWIEKLPLEELQRIKHKKQTQLTVQHYYSNSEMFLNSSIGYIPQKKLREITIERCLEIF